MPVVVPDDQYPNDIITGYVEQRMIRERVKVYTAE